jgi:hypothetical protein
MSDATTPRCIISFNNYTEEVIRITSEGFHYRGQFIADAGEAHRLLVDFLRQQQPKPPAIAESPTLPEPT